MNLLLCETANGLPDMQRVLGKATVQPQDLKAGEENPVRVPAAGVSCPRWSALRPRC